MLAVASHQLSGNLSHQIPEHDSTENTHSILQQWLAFVQAGHYDKLDTLASEDANWWVDGDKSKISLAGDMPYKQRQKMLGDLFAKANTYTTDLLSLTAEGETGVLEVLRKAYGPGDKKYESNAIMRFTVRNGKIVEIREYIDFIALAFYMGLSGIFDVLVHGKP
ncbi:hypothetical protein CVT26_002493 [Gymnopilus dilepis]|uniref:SnoaL-like domain-containing protein n=1 Tax=Gymnopilus dilepis TaxID=231916 RepID=A0A409WAR3_9AGAR|nr:hypothetical protein CVT26_002493 [Gymnopilus dilepis]